jgi:hypothetical protein
LSRRTNVDLGQIHGIILDIICWNIAGLAVYLLLQGTVDAGTTTNGLLARSGKLALLVDVGCVKVWALKGGVESVLAEKVDVGLGTIALVLGVQENSDFASHGGQ